MHTLALLAHYSQTDTAILIKGRFEGNPIWVRFEGEHLDMARNGILKSYFSMMKACGDVDKNTVMLMNVQINGPETDNTITAQAWTWSTYNGRHSGGRIIPKAAALENAA